MNKKTFIAKIKWFTEIEGGRKTKVPFKTEKYGPLIVFDGLIGSWSFIVNNYEDLDNNESLAKVHYLNTDDAPDNLTIGLRFELFEGKKKVGSGQIIEEVK